MRLRPTFIVVHRTIGLATAGFLAVAGLSGSLAVFGPEIDAALNPQIFNVSTGPALPLTTLVGGFEAAHPDWQVTFIEPPLRAGMPVRLGIAAAKRSRPSAAYDEAWLDPATGRMKAMRDTQLLRLDRLHLVPLVRRIHFTLLLPGKWGAWIMGSVAIAWGINCVIGFYLTLPHGQRFWQRWKSAWLIKRRAPLFRRQLDLHRTFGLWLWGILLMMAVSGLSLNLAREVFRPAIGFFGPLTPLPADTIPKLKHPAPSPRMDWDKAGELALKQLPEGSAAWRIRYIGYLPERGVWRVRMVEPEFREGRFKIREEQVYLRTVDQDVVRHVSYYRGTTGDRFIEWQYPLHTGRMFGLLGGLLTCFTGLVVSLLSITGVYIWWAKRAPRVGRGRSQKKAIANAAL